MNDDLLMRILCFHYDLTHFNQKAQERLNHNECDHFLNSNYFTNDEMKFLLEMMPNDGSSGLKPLKFELQNLIKNKNICTSHQIAPILQKYFSIHKKYEKTNKFKNYYKKFNK